MERLEPEFEDDKLRIWRLASGDEPPEQDPTVLPCDTATEELYESRVYDVEPEALLVMTVEAMDEHQDVPPFEFVGALERGLADASFRILAKRDKSEGLVTFILVGSFAGTRTLLAREERVDEARFRAFVREFEEPALRNGLLGPPTIIDIDAWRVYETGSQ